MNRWLAQDTRRRTLKTCTMFRRGEWIQPYQLLFFSTGLWGIKRIVRRFTACPLHCSKQMLRHDSFLMNHSALQMCLLQAMRHRRRIIHLPNTGRQAAGLWGWNIHLCEDTRACLRDINTADAALQFMSCAQVTRLSLPALRSPGLLLLLFCFLWIHLSVMEPNIWCMDTSYLHCPLFMDRYAPKQTHLLFLSSGS